MLTFERKSYIRNLKQARMVTVAMRQPGFSHLKETMDHRNWYLVFVLWLAKYFIVSKRTQLNALKSNSTNNFHRFKSYRRPEYVKTTWVTLYSEQRLRWDYSWDKKLSIIFVLDKIFYWKEGRRPWRSRRVFLRSQFSRGRRRHVPASFREGYSAFHQSLPSNFMESIQ